VTFVLANTDFTDWGGGIWLCDKSVSAITSDIVASGAVLGYYQTGMMVTLPWMSDNQLLRKYFHHNVGTIRMVTADYSGSPVLAGAGTWKFVIITGQAIAKNANIDYSDYEQVKRAFNLQD